MSGALLAAAGVALLVTLATNAALVGFLRWRQRSRRRIAKTDAMWRSGGQGLSSGGTPHQPGHVVVDGSVDEQSSRQPQPDPPTAHFRSRDPQSAWVPRNPVVDRLRFLATQFVEDDPRSGTEAQSGIRHGDETGGRP